jgi:hypothetical protein
MNGLAQAEMPDPMNPSLMCVTRDLVLASDGRGALYLLRKGDEKVWMAGAAYLQMHSLHLYPVNSDLWWLALANYSRCCISAASNGMPAGREVGWAVLQ